MNRRSTHGGRVRADRVSSVARKSASDYDAGPRALDGVQVDGYQPLDEITDDGEDDVLCNLSPSIPRHP